MSVYYLHTDKSGFKKTIINSGQLNIDLEVPQAFILFDDENNALYSEALGNQKVSKKAAEKIFSNCTKRLVLDVNYFNLDYLCFPENKETRFCVVTKSKSLENVVGLESDEEEHPVQVIRHTGTGLLHYITKGENYIIDITKGRFCVLGDSKYTCNAQQNWQNELALGISDSLNWYPLPYKCRGKDKIKSLWSCMEQNLINKATNIIYTPLKTLGLVN